MRKPRYTLHQGLAVLAYRHTHPVILDEIGRDPLATDTAVEVEHIIGVPAREVRVECLRALGRVMRGNFKDAYEATCWVMKHDWRAAMWAGFCALDFLRSDNEAVQRYYEVERAKMLEWFAGTRPAESLDRYGESPDVDINHRDYYGLTGVWWMKREMEVGPDEDRYGGREGIAHVGMFLASGAGDYQGRAKAHADMLPHIADRMADYPDPGIPNPTETT